MFGSFRGRLIATVIALIALTAGSVATLSYVLVGNSLREQLIEDSVGRAEFNIAVLATPEQLAPGAGRADFEASGLAERFLLRGSGGVFVDFADGETFSSTPSLLGAGSLLSPELRDVVAQGEYGYEFITVEETPTLVVGGRRPPDGPDFYFFYSAAEVENTLNSLGRVVALAGLGVVILGALGAGLIARRVLRPVATAGEAAQIMADGDLSVRLPTPTRDELGRLAVAFNQMAAALEDQIAELVEARERERRFVADVSHELRTPLTALVNEAARLEPVLDELPAADGRVGRMLVADVARLRSLVEDLLEVSRLAAGSTPPEEADIDLPRFLAALRDDRHPSARLDHAGSTTWVRADRRALESIIGNLLDNARIHAPGAEVIVQARLEDQALVIEVADHGPGVPPDALPHLFERFYKTDAARQGGSGLGLAIAREHAKLLGGDLTARPGRADGGLVFELRIPVTEPLRSGDPAEKAVSEPEGGHTVHHRRTP